MTEELKTTFLTPLGRLSYPVLLKGRPNPQGVDKWGVQILVTPEIFKKEGGALIEAINRVGKEKLGKTWELKTAAKKCIQKTDEMDVKDDKTKGLICIKTVASNPPIVVGPNGQKMDPEAIQRIRGGHWGRAVVNVYAYNKAGNKGVSLGLNVLQYWKPDEEFGAGASASLALIDQLEVPVADVNINAAAFQSDDIPL